MYDVLDIKTVENNVNNLTFTDYYYRLMLMARCVFKWEGLPNNIDEKWIERFLFTKGHCMFFYDEGIGYVVAQCNISDKLNNYDEPTLLNPYATNYQFKGEYKNNKNCVLIRNNDLMLPTAPTLQLYAMRLSEIQRTIDINIAAQRTPVLIKCSEKQRLSLKAVYRQWKGNEPVIFGDKNLDTSEFTVLNTGAPAIFDKLQIQKHAIWNEVMTYLGINNANMDKRERLVDDEVQANNEQIELSAAVMLKSREKACELINKVFPDCKVSVKMRNREEIQKAIEGGAAE